MRRILRRIGFGLAVTGLLALFVLDIYTDWHPEVLMEFKAEHPSLFPTNPWLAWGVGGTLTLGIWLFGWWQYRRYAQRNRHTDVY
jgi:hypothetical protein